MGKKLKGIIQYKGPNGSKFTCGSIASKNFLIAGGDNCDSMHVYNFSSAAPISSYTGFNSDVTCVRFSFDESKVFAGTFGGTLDETTLRGHLTHVRCVVDQKEDISNYVFSGASDTNVKVWDLRQKGATATYKGHDKAISAIDVSPDTGVIASGCTGGIVKMWDLQAGKCLYSFNVKSQSQVESCFIKDIKFNPADCCIAVACSDKIIRYYDTSTFELINESLADVHPISNIDFDSNGEFVITAYSDTLKNMGSRK